MYTYVCVWGGGGCMHELSVVIPTHECLHCWHVYMCTCVHVYMYVYDYKCLPPTLSLSLRLSLPPLPSLSPSLSLPLSPLPPPLPPLPISLHVLSLCLLRNSKTERSCPQSGTSSRRPLVVKHSKQELNTSPEQSSGPLITHILTQHTSLSPLMFR